MAGKRDGDGEGEREGWEDRDGEIGRARGRDWKRGDGEGWRDREGEREGLEEGGLRGMER